MNKALLPEWQLQEPDTCISKEAAAPEALIAFPEIPSHSSKLKDPLSDFMQLIIIRRKIIIAFLTDLVLICYNFCKCNFALFKVRYSKTKTIETNVHE